MNTPIPTVFVVDDEESVRKGLARLLRSAGFSAVTFGSPCEFLDVCDPGVPGCLVLDVAMPGLNGLELQQALTNKGVGLPIIFLTGRADIPMTVQAMKQGAADFLTKPVNDETLLATIRNAIERDRLRREAQVHRDAIEQRLATLTARQREVLALVIAGKLNKQIASALGTVEKTVKIHRGEVMRKMGVQSVAELVRLTERVGLQPGSGEVSETGGK